MENTNNNINEIFKNSHEWEDGYYKEILKIESLLFLCENFGLKLEDKEESKIKEFATKVSEDCYGVFEVFFNQTKNNDELLDIENPKYDFEKEKEKYKVSKFLHNFQSKYEKYFKKWGINTTEVHVLYLNELGRFNCFPIKYIDENLNVDPIFWENWKKTEHFWKGRELKHLCELFLFEGFELLLAALYLDQNLLNDFLEILKKSKIKDFNDLAKKIEFRHFEDRFNLKVKKINLFLTAE